MPEYLTWQMLLSLMMGALISYVAIPPIVRVAKAKQLVALPNGRTSHNGAVPALGGIAIFAGLLVGSSLFVMDGFPAEFQFFIPAFLIIFFIGLKDDIVHISPFARLAGQIIAAFLVVVLAGVKISTFHGLFGINELPEWLSYIFSIFVFVCIVNAYNLIDGIDGLASGMGIIHALIFGVWVYKLGYVDYGVLAFALLGGLIPFYIFNVFGKSYKLFMGDTGSTLIGMVFAILALRILCCEYIPVAELNFNALPAVVVAVMVIPIADTLRIFTIRIAMGKSPFAADRNHFHHYLLRLGMGHWQASTSIIGLNVIVIFAAIIMRDMPARWVLLITVGSVFLIMIGVKWMVNHEFQPFKKTTRMKKMQTYPD
jgi:UDP-GlcNAc:undecaprenyl-phosphate/decaprenyl-phosphate GlcNAc-1-phosphate transferase